MAHLRILVELVQAAFGRERHIVLRQALEPFFPGLGREDRSQLAADGIVAVDTALAVVQALRASAVSYDVAPLADYRSPERATAAE